LPGNVQYIFITRQPEFASDEFNLFLTMPGQPTPIITEARPLLHAQAQLGEGAIWNPLNQKLYWVDILGSAFHIYDPEAKTDRAFPTGDYVGTVVPLEDGDVLLALQTGIHRMNTETSELTLLSNPLPRGAVRFNDGKCDPSGRFWVGTISMDGARGSSKLYRYDRDGSLHEMLSDVSISNGIVWTTDKKTMYYNDTPTLTVQVFDYDDATGAISNRRIAFRIPEGHGYPDGMSIDTEDKLWIAMWGVGSINRYDPQSGALLQQVKVPAPHTSSCAFGGKDLQTLYITTARAEMEAGDLARYPLSGDLFIAEVEVRGVPANYYKPV
jgi:sugar lactone lactonase YvrE